MSDKTLRLPLFTGFSLNLTPGLEPEQRNENINSLGKSRHRTHSSRVTVTPLCPYATTASKIFRILNNIKTKCYFGFWFVLVFHVAFEILKSCYNILWTEVKMCISRILQSVFCKRIYLAQFLHISIEVWNHIKR